MAALAKYGAQYWRPLGLGVSGTVLEIGMGAVLAKIILLVLVILFIQKRPQGLFAIKGRFCGVSA